MADLKISKLNKVFKNGVKAVEDLSLEVKDSEFIVIVGPSGCGKSTTLRMIAGLEEVTSGSITLGGCIINNVDVRERDIAMVFQNYALYDNMTVYGNIAFPLKIRKEPADIIDSKVREIARILKIEELLDRRPSALSGGEKQRTAMGRALVRQPKLFLMDEPLSNLDARLRVELRKEIRRIQQSLGTTTIYVTHDQSEAMTMADRVVVMNKGRACQIDTPENIYDHPADPFVAGFFGTPAMNIWEEDNVTFGIRPEDIIIADKGTSAVIREQYFSGDRHIFQVAAEGREFTLCSPRRFDTGSEINIILPEEKIHRWEKDDRKKVNS